MRVHCIRYKTPTFSPPFCTPLARATKMNHIECDALRCVAASGVNKPLRTSIQH